MNKFKDLQSLNGWSDQKMLEILSDLLDRSGLLDTVIAEVKEISGFEPDS